MIRNCGRRRGVGRRSFRLLLLLLRERREVVCRGRGCREGRRCERNIRVGEGDRFEVSKCRESLSTWEGAMAQSYVRGPLTSPHGIYLANMNVSFMHFQC
jgi:hypothetical protein